MSTSLPVPTKFDGSLWERAFTLTIAICVVLLGLVGLPLVKTSLEAGPPPALPRASIVFYTLLPLVLVIVMCFRCSWGNRGVVAIARRHMISSDLRRLLEHSPRDERVLLSLSLMLGGIAICTAFGIPAAGLANPTQAATFVVLYSLFLFVDSIWLLLRLRHAAKLGFARTTDDIDARAIRRVFDVYLFWIGNNVTTVVIVLVLGRFLEDDHIYQAAAIIALTLNTLLDVYVAYPIYRERFAKDLSA